MAPAPLARRRPLTSCPTSSSRRAPTILSGRARPCTDREAIGLVQGTDREAIGLVQGTDREAIGLVQGRRHEGTGERIGGFCGTIIMNGGGHYAPI